MFGFFTGQEVIFYCEMTRLWTQDLAIILRGLRSVINATVKSHEAQCKQVWGNSSLKEIAEELSNKMGKDALQTLTNPDAQASVTRTVSEALERTSMVMEGVKGYIKVTRGIELPIQKADLQEHELNEVNLYGNSTSVLKKTDIHLQSTRVIKNNTVEFQSEEYDIKQNIQEDKITTKGEIVEAEYVISMQHDKNEAVVGRLDETMNYTQRVKKRQSLSESARQRKVPSSRLGRLVSFGSLAAGLGVGTMAELTRRTLGITQDLPTLDSAFLTPANAERIVNTLCKVRGAALKIGQVLSIQDSTIISPTLQKAFERVRQSADFMPSWQVEKVLQSELGDKWRTKLSSFEEKPFAAASIGQVHLAVLPSGQEVAMKIQYPGVAKGIKSDIDNLVGIIKVWNIFPEGFFIDNLVEVAKRELSWEVDYKREAECTNKFRELLKPYPEYLIPRVIDELSAQHVFTTELVEGIPVDKVADMDYKTRQHICRLVMQLCLRELFEFRYMQTDPNWSNFLYNPETRQLALLDFGASREYSKEFMDQYIRIVKGASDGDRDMVLRISHDIGFLTGYESKIMEEAHVDAVMILGEVFRSKEPFDFGGQSTTQRIQGLVPTMVKHRLCPPPEEIYSLHRKLSGVFLLCAKLNVRVDCRPMFQQVYEAYSQTM